jgi:signal transduction histidine kinase
MTADLERRRQIERWIAWVRLLLNLLSNAAKYTVAGDEIEVRAAADNGAVLVGVEDHGPGIPLPIG